MRIPFISYQLGTMKKLLTASLTAITAVMLLPNVAIPGLGGVANAADFEPYRDAKGYIYNQTSSASLTGTIYDVPKLSSIKTDACGMALVKNLSPTEYYRFGNTGNYSERDNLPGNTIPTCNKTTGVLSSPRTTSFQSNPPTPGVNFVYIGAANTTVPIWITEYKVVKATKNTCGIAKIKLPKFDPIGIGEDMQFSYDLPGTSGDDLFSTFPLSTASQICRKNAAGGGTLYVPAPN
jgi:hypothetical protein